MQIEWSEGEGLKFAGVGTEAEGEVRERVVGRIDGRKRRDRGREAAKPSSRMPWRSLQT
jgi:hypothetical protein